MFGPVTYHALVQSQEECFLSSRFSRLGPSGVRWVLAFSSTAASLATAKKIEVCGLSGHVWFGSVVECTDCWRSAFVSIEDVVTHLHHFFITTCSLLHIVNAVSILWPHFANLSDTILFSVFYCWVQTGNASRSTGDCLNDLGFCSVDVKKQMQVESVLCWNLFQNVATASQSV